MDEFRPESPKPNANNSGEELYSGAPTEPESTDPLSDDRGHEYHGSLDADQGLTKKSSEAKHSFLDVFRKKAVAIPTAIGAAAAAGALAWGISSMNSGKDDSNLGSQPVAEAPVTPGPSETPTTAASPTETESATPEATPSPTLTPEKSPTQAEVNEYASWAEQYTGMDVATFESLPRGDRLAYAQYLMDFTVSRRVYDSLYNNKYLPHTDDVITPIPATLDDTGDQIIKRNGYNLQLSMIQLVSEGVSKPTLDKDKARETLSGVYYTVGDDYASNVYRGILEKIENTEKPTAIDINWTATDTSKLMKGHNQEGDEVQYKIVTFHADTDDQGGNKTKYAEYVYQTFTSYDGSQRSIWLLDMVGDSMKQLKDSTTIKK